MPGLSLFLFTKDAPQRGTRGNVTLGEEWSSQPAGQHAVSVPPGKTRVSTGRVCMCTRVTCVSGHRLLGGVLLQVWVPFPTCLDPHYQYSWVSQIHTTTPIAGDLLNFLVFQRGTPPSVQAPASWGVFIHPTG